MYNVHTIYSTFMTVLYIEMKYKNKSQYLARNTMRYISYVLYDSPKRVFLRR